MTRIANEGHKDEANVQISRISEPNEIQIDIFYYLVSVPPVRAKIIREWGHFAMGQAYNVSCQVS